MVNDGGILYTIEGIAAGILMIVTAYLIISTTTVFTPGDTHIFDMQQEQLGEDVLAVMDTPLDDTMESPLEVYIRTNDTDAFRTAFSTLSKANSQNWAEEIKFSSDVYYRKIDDDTIDHYPFSHSGLTGDVTGHEHTVKVTRRVLVTNVTGINPSLPIDKTRSQSVLLEVLMWRD